MALRVYWGALAGSVLTACLLGLATVAPALADLDGDGFDGDELIVPLILGALLIAGGIAYWRSRGTRPREG
jgi:peptidoglycan/LPS O-acetylase OafA/YrhL